MFFNKVVTHSEYSREIKINFADIVCSARYHHLSKSSVTPKYFNICHKKKSLAERETLSS